MSSSRLLQHRLIRSGGTFVAAFLLLAVAGCAGLGPTGKPVSGKGVFVYFLLPPHYRVVARLNTTGYGGYVGSGRLNVTGYSGHMGSSMWNIGMDYRVLKRLRRQAQRLGANGVLLERVCGVACVIKDMGSANAPENGSLIPSDFWVYRAEAIRVPNPTCPFPTKLCGWLEPSRRIAELANRNYLAYSVLTTASLRKGVLRQSVTRVKQIYLSCPGIGASRAPARIEARVGRNGRVEAVRIIQMGIDLTAGSSTPNFPQGFLWTIRRWRFQPLMVGGKPHAFDLLMLLKRISWKAWHQGHKPYLCSTQKSFPPTWYVYLPKKGSDALPLAVAAATRHPSR
ncbi:MAG: energy transducer TonB [Gammaproteobacteria bacterium]